MAIRIEDKPKPVASKAASKATPKAAPKEFSFLTIGKRGRPSKGQEKVTLRIDPDVLAKFRATGEGWQGRINEILKEAKP